jgi:hypothetical protein
MYALSCDCTVCLNHPWKDTPSVSGTYTEPVQSTLQSHALSFRKHFKCVSLAHAQIPQLTSSSNTTSVKLCTYFSCPPRVLHVHTLLLDLTADCYDIL